MNYILNIDTALETASVCLAGNGKPMAFLENHTPKEHSSWLHSAISSILKDSNCSFSQLSAISVNTGPGSYTGLRIGLSAAKGFSYAIDKPLITTSSLELIAFANKEIPAEVLCPIIDARRMEVYFAVYSKELKPVIEPTAHIVTQNSFSALLDSNKVLFCGTGSKKLQTQIFHTNAAFSNINGSAKELAAISYQKYLSNSFASLADADPLYIKDFYTSGQKTV